MFCPYCGGFNSDGSEVCRFCHGRFSVTAPAAPAPRKGRIWLPLAILGAMLVMGLFLFFTIPLSGGPSVDPDMPWFSIENGTLYFDESRHPGGTTLTVPRTVAGQKVRIISEYCFYGCDTFSAIELPEGIEEIGPSAFAGCQRLRGIKLPETLTFIGGEAFSGCSRLEAIAIPYTVKTVGIGIFDGCDALRHIYYPGTTADWQLLDLEGIGPKTRIYCIDGVVTGG